MSLIKSVDVGNGDLFYIVHNSDNFTIIDCNMDEEHREEILNELITEASKKTIRRFISTHPDDDHIRGLKYLDDEMNVINFYCVKNEVTKDEITEDFERYCELRDSTKAFYIYKGCTRNWMNRNEGKENYGSAGINILWPDTNNENYVAELENTKDGSSPNNISPIIKYSLSDGVTALWFGDMESSFMEKIKDEVDFPQADIVFAPHHGRKSGKLIGEWLENINPKIIVIGNAPSEEIDYSYSRNYNTITQNSAGDIIFDCTSGMVDVYVSKSGYSVDFLDDGKKSDAYGCNYIGTLYL